ncbi:MAG: ketopantoate reductase family protein [Candidatus Heimdallarchaeota archaeon]
MKILFFGAGAIGSLFGGLLAAHEDVWLISRKELFAAIESNGLLVISEGRKLRTYPKASVNIPSNHEFDCIVVTTKAFDLKNALLDIQKANLNGIPIVILQNGYGNEDLAKKILPNSLIMRAITTEGASCPATGQVMRAGVGRTFLGSLGPSEIQETFSRRLAKVFSASGLPAIATDEINSWVWAKLLINAAINPICALVNCSNGHILENPILLELSRKLVRELLELTNALQLKLPFENLQTEVERVIQETRDNRCSMLQDIMAGRPTEIEFLNGAVSILAKIHELSAPVNDMLTKLILGRQRTHLVKASL